MVGEDSEEGRTPSVSSVQGVPCLPGEEEEIHHGGMVIQTLPGRS